MPWRARSCFAARNLVLIWFRVAESGELDLNLLFTLHALLEEQSITRAAARLGRSPPAVSQALGRLRTALGDPILVRAGRAMVPSPRAKELREPVERLIVGVAAVFEPRAEFVPSRSERTFLVRGSDYVVHVLGVTLDHSLRSEAPMVSLNFMPNSIDDPDRIRDGSVDLAIGVYRDLHPEIRIQKLFEESLVCVVRREHPVVRKRLTLQQYATLQHVQIAPRGRGGGIVDDALAKRGLRRAVVRRVPFFFAGLVLASRTDLVLTLPRRLAVAEAARHDLRLLELPVPVDSYPVSQIWHPRHEGDPAHRWFRRSVVAAAKASKPRGRA